MAHMPIPQRQVVAFKTADATSPETCSVEDWLVYFDAVDDSHVPKY